jgi:Zn-dependent M28 family amino/carboxypeptidase
MKILAVGFVALLALSSARAQQHPRDGQIDNADTLAWWHTTEALSNDAMEGRDTGTAAYQRAAEYVAKRFEAAGLKPAGENGTYFQVVPMHEIDTLAKGTSFVVESKGGALKLEFLQEITATWTPEMLKAGEGELTFRGYCGKDAMGDIAGKIVVCFGTQRMGLPSGAERARNAREGGAKGIVNVDDPYFSIEPPRWPYAYARSVTLKDPAAKERAAGTPTMLPAMRMSAEAFAKLLQGSGQDAAAVLKAGGAKEPLASFEIPVKMEAAEKDISSPNVLAVWPGSDAAVGDEMVVAGAHLDGYGYGTPVKGDGLYNGTLDDAAYVALLIQMADDLHAGMVKKGGLQQVAYEPGVIVDKGMSLAAPKRSILFAVFTGEEKGLLGSNWYVQHLTVPKEKLVADVNLDQLRPLFPLKILTAEAVNDTTLGATAREVGAGMGVEIREDREPERGLLRRADQFPFLRMGVPAISFIFGYDPGTDAEKRYREWYQVRYHRPQDDLTQPMDFQAATRFDVFFYRLIETIANAEKRPEFLPGSPLAPKK